MGLYERRVAPYLIDLGCAAPGMSRWRAKALVGLAGEVLEIGFGSGRNLPLMSEAVTRVLAVEPSEVMWRRSAHRRARAPFPVTRVGLDGQRIDLTEPVDAALITFTLCSVNDPARVLGEVARLLRPGGRLHLLEHGLAPDARLAAWQHRLDPLERRVAGGCSLTHDPRAALERAGFTILDLRQRYAGPAHPWSYFTYALAEPPR